jgi:hypothetical protein
MKRVRPHIIGLVFAAFLAMWHTLWSLLVAVGVAQPVIDFVFRLHMITPPYKIAEFHLSTAVGLVLVTAGIGYLAGWAIGLIWNRCIPVDAGVQEALWSRSSANLPFDRRSREVGCRCAAGVLGGIPRACGFAQAAHRDLSHYPHTCRSFTHFKGVEDGEDIPFHLQIKRSTTSVTATRTNAYTDRIEVSKSFDNPCG